MITGLGTQEVHTGLNAILLYAGIVNPSSVACFELGVVFLVVFG